MEASRTITFGILTVSDRCFLKKAVDESSCALEQCLSESAVLPNYKVEVKSCVPDEALIIQQVLKSWADELKIHVILTTGGTGFAPRDVTPEATRLVIEKEAPALAMAMTKGSLAKTPMAMLSRAVCGIRERTVIINLPGSKKGAVECLGFIIECIPHAVALTQDWLQQVQQVHTTVQNGHLENTNSKVVNEVNPDSNKAFPAHSCGHHKVSSKVDVSQVARRLRNSPYPMVSYKESIVLVDNYVSYINKSTQEISVSNALGYVLAKKVVAQENLPPFPASIKDGYAVLTSDGEGVRKVVAASTAGSQPSRRCLSSGECVRVNTGAPVPEGADAVVQVEDTMLVAEADDGRQELEVNILVEPKVFQEIRAVGSDICKGTLIAQVNGNPLSSQDLGLFAAAGVNTVQVYRRPIVAMFSTGNELQEPGQKLSPGQVWDTNRLMLSSLFKESGFQVINLGIAKDEPNTLLAVMKTALNSSDIVITTGSVSMGDKDMLKPILTHDLNAEIHFGRVNLKPGKPTTFATYKAEDGSSKLIFCLPGNPVSAYVTSHLYVLRTIRALCGYSQVDPTVIYAKYDLSKHKFDVREEFKRGKVTVHKNEATVEVIGGCMLSSNILSCQSSNCLVRFPPSGEINQPIGTETYVECLLTGKL